MTTLSDNADRMRVADSHVRRGTSPAVPARVKAAVEIMLDQPGALDYAALAKAVGFRDARALRKALTLPQSTRYLRERKRERLEQLNAANPEALRKVRDESSNSMAKVAAIKAMEGLSERMDEEAGARIGAPAPGVVIVIEAPGQPDRIVTPRLPTLLDGPVIDVDPVDEDETAPSPL